MGLTGVRFRREAVAEVVAGTISTTTNEKRLEAALDPRRHIYVFL